MARKIIILNELGILQNIKDINNYTDKSPVAKEVAKLLKLESLAEKRNVQRIVNDILGENKESEKNPYSAPGNKNFISEIRRLLE